MATICYVTAFRTNGNWEYNECEICMHKMRDLPSLELLKAFEAAARHLSFTRAGSELFLSQSAVSRQIQQLEAQLGMPLFIRRTRALLLTESGKRYYKDVNQALNQLRAAGASLAATPTGRLVTVTTTVTFASLWLVPHLADFQQQHPDIEVRIAADNAMRDLASGQIDVAIRYSTRPHAGPDAVRLFGEYVLPVISPTLARKGSLRRAEDLNRFVLLHFEDPVMATPWLTWEVWFEAMKAPPPSPKGVLRFSHYDMMLRAAINGQGVALGRLPLIAPTLASGTLVAPLRQAQFKSSLGDRAYWLIASPASRERPQVRTFMQWLSEKVSPMTRKPGAAQ
jgi:LysR family glycine cleavage system transcriptional activator